MWASGLMYATGAKLHVKVTSGTVAPVQIQGYSDASTPKLLVLGTASYPNGTLGLTTISGHGYLETYGAMDLHLRPNQSTGMVIKAGGKVGISTPSPGKVLTVVGDDSTAGNWQAREAVVRIQNIDDAAADSRFAGCQFTFSPGHDSTADNYVVGTVGAVLTDTSTQWAGDLVFGVKAATTSTTISEAMRIKTGGNVGIGTVDPNKVLHVVGDIEISGAIYQSGSLFEGGGGGGSSTFAGLSDTPGSLTANKYLSVNSAGNAVEMVDAIQSGYATLDQGIFTGFDLTGSAVGIVQNASGIISDLNLADNKFDVSVIEERDTFVGDSSFDKVELLLPFDGANTATSTTDESDSSHTVSFNGNAKISTTQKKFGVSSCYFDGTGDYLAISSSSDFAFGAGDFTIEFWVRRASTGSYPYLLDFRSGGTDAVVATLYLDHTDSYKPQYYVNGAARIDSSVGLSVDTWYHIAIVRSSGTTTMYVDGSSAGSFSDSFTYIAAPLRVGDYSSGGYGFPGYVDDLRITKGLARYTSSFTAPSAALPTSASITAAKYIGQIGGIDDSDVDYGIEKLSNSQLMIKKLSDNTFAPDRLYVNVNRLGALGQGIAFDQVYTGDGVTTNYLLTDDVPSARDVLVSVQGLVQTPTIDYTLAGTTGVSFTTGVTSGDEVSFRYLALGPSGADGADGAAGSDGAAGATGPSGAAGADGADASGWATTDQGYFTGFDLTGSAVGIVQNASGSVAGLDLADNKWDVSIVEETDTDVVAGDANWTDVSLLLPFDGSNAATSTTDESDTGHTVTFNGTAQISTAQSKFGGSSLLLDGNSDYIQVADHDSFDFGAGNFTVECWVRFDSLFRNTIFSQFCNGTSSSQSYYLAYLTGSLRLGYYLGSNADTSYSWSPSTGTWYHIALERSGTTLKVYIDGTSVISVSASTTALQASEDPFRVGVFNDGSTGSPSLDWYFDGHIDDLRITKGTARYGTNFTPPAAAFYTNASVNVVETKYIGQIGGWDDTDVDYGIKKISNSELSVKKMGADVVDRPIDRLYVNVQKLGAVGEGVAFSNTFTADGIVSGFALDSSVPQAKDLLVTINGIIQRPIVDYTLSNNTGVYFNSALTSGFNVEARHLSLGPTGAPGPAGVASFAKDVFTGNGVVSGFTMGRSVSNILETTVFLNGLAQFPDDNYFVNGTSLTFADGDIASGDLIMVRHVY